MKSHLYWDTRQPHQLKQYLHENQLKLENNKPHIITTTTIAAQKKKPGDTKKEKTITHTSDNKPKTPLEKTKSQRNPHLNAHKIRINMINKVFNLLSLITFGSAKCKKLRLIATAPQWHRRHSQLINWSWYWYRDCFSLFISLSLIVNLHCDMKTAQCIYDSNLG